MASVKQRVVRQLRRHPHRHRGVRTARPLSRFAAFPKLTIMGIYVSLSRFKARVLHRGTQAMIRVRPRGLSTTLELRWREADNRRRDRS